MAYQMQILREKFKEPPRKGKSPKDVLVKAKQQLWTTQWPHSMNRGVCLLNLINPTQQVAVSLDLLPTGKWDTLPEGSLCFVCDLYSHSETARGKSLWIHQKEQKNYPWRFPKKVVGFNLGLSNHKSSSTNRVEEKSKSGNRSTCWAHFCGVALKLRQISWHVPNSIHVASNMANFRGCFTFKTSWNQFWGQGNTQARFGRWATCRQGVL